MLPGKALTTFTFLCFSILQKGKFTFQNSDVKAKIIVAFIQIMQSLGMEIEIIKEDIYVNSRGAFHLFPPSSEIDTKGEEDILYALCGLFCPYDYNIFFIDSLKNSFKKPESGFSALILGFYEMGARFSYSEGFKLPLSMKGTSNLMPMKHSIFSENFGLHLAFTLAGLSGLGETSVISSSKILPWLHGILKLTGADAKLLTLEDRAFELIVSSEETLDKQIIIDINGTLGYERI